MLSIRSLPILFFFLTVFQLTYGRDYENEKVHGSVDTDFDLLIFTQHWPETVCSEWREKVPSHRCLLPRTEEWTIHGIWPDKYHTMGPFFCNNTLRFDETALHPIVNELDEKWINIEDGTPHYSFWRHEWEKHGTCAAVISELNTEFKFFNKGLDLLKKYDMTKVLAKENIMPGHTYTVQQIIDGIEKFVGKPVNVQCEIDPKTHESYIFEIRICMDKSLNVISCAGIPSFPTNCNKKIPVNYPPRTMPNNYNAILV